MNSIFNQLDFNLDLLEGTDVSGIDANIEEVLESTETLFAEALILLSSNETDPHAEREFNRRHERYTAMFAPRDGAQSDYEEENALLPSNRQQTEMTSVSTKVNLDMAENASKNALLSLANTRESILNAKRHADRTQTESKEMSRTLSRMHGEVQSNALCLCIALLLVLCLLFAMVWKWG